MLKDEQTRGKLELHANDNVNAPLKVAA